MIGMKIIGHRDRLRVLAQKNVVGSRGAPVAHAPSANVLNFTVRTTYKDFTINRTAY
jgi:hypothetical protein